MKANTCREIVNFRMSVFNNHGEIENVGPSEQLILPTDIFVNPVGVVEGETVVIVSTLIQRH